MTPTRPNTGKPETVEYTWVDWLFYGAIAAVVASAIVLAVISGG